MKNGFHHPVLLEQAVKYLIAGRAGIYVDCTLGGGGHSYHFLSHLLPGAHLIGLDADPEALAHAAQRLEKFPNKDLRRAFFDQIEFILYESDKYPVDGIFYDLGISSFQVDESPRGFSFRNEGPLDMRFDPRQENTAARVVNRYSEEELGRIIKEYGEERHWRAIAREIVLTRSTGELRTTQDLAMIVKSVVGERFLNKSLARVFQAVRIEVNQELQRLQNSLESAYRMLNQGGRLVVISYHSLEDRIVKTFIKEKNRDCICPPDLPACVCDKIREMKILTRRPVVPGHGEIKANPRSRSAKLRAAEKIVPFENPFVAQ